MLEQLGFEACDVFHRNGVEVPTGTQEDRHDLILDGVRRVLGLLEQLHQPRTAVQLGL